MATLAKLTAALTGFNGAPGFTNFFFAAAAGPDVTQAVVNDAVTRTDTFLNSWNAKLPPSVNVTLQSQVELINDSNGQLVSFLNATPFQRANGTGTGNYSAASGAVVNWYTGGVRNGRRVRGRSFFVPLAGNALGPNGTIDDATLGTVRASATAMCAPVTGASKLVVWSRPSAKGATDGISYDVISATVPDMTAVLRSRRD